MNKSVTFFLSKNYYVRTSWRSHTERTSSSLKIGNFSFFHFLLVRIRNTSCESTKLGTCSLNNINNSFTRAEIFENYAGEKGRRRNENFSVVSDLDLGLHYLDTSGSGSRRAETAGTFFICIDIHIFTSLEEAHSGGLTILCGNRIFKLFIFMCETTSVSYIKHYT